MDRLPEAHRDVNIRGMGVLQPSDSLSELPGDADDPGNFRIADASNSRRA